MVKILLSCDATDFDIALTLKSTFEESCGYKVFLELDDWKQEEENDEGLAFEDDFDNKLEGAAVLLVFEFGESSISAWVMLEETDERNTRNANPRKSIFPECIDFEPSFSQGIRIFNKILKTDFGLITRPRNDQKTTETTNSQHITLNHNSHRYFNMKLLRDTHDFYDGKLPEDEFFSLDDDIISSKPTTTSSFTNYCFSADDDALLFTSVDSLYFDDGPVDRPKQEEKPDPPCGALEELLATTVPVKIYKPNKGRSSPANLEPSRGNHTSFMMETAFLKEQLLEEDSDDEQW